MYTSVHVWICLYMHMCIHICMYTNIYIHTYTIPWLGQRSMKGHIRSTLIPHLIYIYTHAFYTHVFQKISIPESYSTIKYILYLDWSSGLWRGIYVWVHIYICTYIYIYIHKNIKICLYIHTYTGIYHIIDIFCTLTGAAVCEGAYPKHSNPTFNIYIYTYILHACVSKNIHTWEL
jgi:hypothetical protein